MNWNSLQIVKILWCWRKLLLTGVDGGHLLIILYEIITFNAKKFLIRYPPDFWKKKFLISWFKCLTDSTSSRKGGTDEILDFTHVLSLEKIVCKLFYLLKRYNNVRESGNFCYPEGSSPLPPHLEGNCRSWPSDLHREGTLVFMSVQLRTNLEMPFWPWDLLFLVSTLILLMKWWVLLSMCDWCLNI